MVVFVYPSKKMARRCEPEKELFNHYKNLKQYVPVYD